MQDVLATRDTDVTDGRIGFELSILEDMYLRNLEGLRGGLPAFPSARCSLSPKVFVAS